MKRCGCSNEGDETVFGPLHQCVPPEVRPTPLLITRRVRSIDWPAERYWESTLAPDELEG